MVKVGDKVRCLNPVHGYDVGDIATVNKVTPNDPVQPYRIGEGHWPVIWHGDFELVTYDQNTGGDSGVPVGENTPSPSNTSP